VPLACERLNRCLLRVPRGQALQKALRCIERANPETLYGIFGDAQWTNKERLSDALLRDLIEHFSRISLGNRTEQGDVLGQSYEYLIKKFADATNKKAGEFYTPRPIVRLMVNILDPHEGESIYDPACGTGGMLLEAIHHVRERHGDDRTLWGKLFGQEKNLTTSAIARMNLFLHGAADFQVVRGDTLRNPAFFLGDNLATFDCVIANPEKLYGIFGDAQWTNKDRLSDAMLRDLVEHFSTLNLTLANLPEDELGQGYEYLVKKFADDAGHTAAEFYTNRTVVHLMTEMLQPQPGESIYDPTCGSGGMLLSCITQLRRQGKEWRNVRLFGQERNLMTSAIARMNFFLHGIEDFRIERGDTLSDPKFVEGDRLMRFDVVLANPPYSIKQWDRYAFASDPWGRNLFGTPPQGRADYAFWQHILCSLAPTTGRCAILFPHGVLFRQEEAEMRRKLIEADLIECVLGLGPTAAQRLQSGWRELACEHSIVRFIHERH
jgi:type I restriction-modification system DNA methylase subunit